jgi:DNA-binding MarR family transcriptional regulator
MLTQAGRALVTNHGTFHMRAAGEIFSALSVEEMETLSDLLKKLNQHAAAIRQRP